MYQSQAQGLASLGRNNDSMLVHMTPGEVKGLQALAMAHGGSLTINPQTGLPEAGFLSSILPMIAGFALGPAGLGLTAMQAGLASAAIGTVATGSLKQGIMAGLGAYGGAGLGQGLMAQGASTPTTTAAAANTPVMNVANTGVEGMKTNLYGPGKGIFSTTPSAASNMGLQAYTPPVPIHSGNISSVPTALQGSGPGGFGAAQPGVFTPGSLGGTSIPAPTPGAVTISRVPSEIYGEQPAKFLTNLPQATPYKGEYFTAGKVEDLVPKAYTNKPILNITEMQRNAAAVAPKTFATDATVNAADAVMPRSGLDQLGAGAKTSFSSMEGLKGLYNAMPTGSVIASGITLAEAMKPKPFEEKKDKSLIRPYEFDYGSTNVSGDPYSGSAERTYFNPVFTAKTPYDAPGREYAASGGLMGYAVGGQVEQMASMNAMGANTGYPMANLQTPMYSNPAMQRTEATNVIAPSADAGVGTYNGEVRFARGGDTGPPDTRAFFNPNTSGMSAENYTRSELAGGRRPPIATPTVTPTNQYTYDPKTMQFTQAGGKGEVSGGVAQLAAQPIMQPTPPAQPLIPAINIPAYQTPEQQLGLGGFYNMMNQQLGGYGGYAGYAAGGNVGGMPNLGDYSDGGRLLKGPGDGVSDSIPASIGDRQPARLADGEFVVPARIVSELGNGSTEAGARKLYAMMDRVQKARRKTVGKGKVAVNSKAENTLPA